MEAMIRSGLVRYDRMLIAIAECHEVDEVKDIRDRARAVELYSSQAKNLNAEMRAMEIRIRAERRAGQLLREMRDSGERQSPGSSGGRGLRKSPEVTIKELGVSKKQSSDWQKLADIPEDEFERRFSSGEIVTTKALVRSTKVESSAQKKKNESRKYAMALWSRLRDLPGLFEKREMKSVIAAMDRRIREDILESIPLVRELLDLIESEINSANASPSKI